MYYVSWACSERAPGCDVDTRKRKNIWSRRDELNRELLCSSLDWYSISQAVKRRCLVTMFVKPILTVFLCVCVCVSFNSPSPCLLETIKIECVFSFVCEWEIYTSWLMLSGACYIMFVKMLIICAWRGCLNTQTSTCCICIFKDIALEPLFFYFHCIISILKLS